MSIALRISGCFRAKTLLLALGLYACSSSSGSKDGGAGGAAEVGTPGGGAPAVLDAGAGVDVSSAPSGAVDAAGALADVGIAAGGTIGLDGGIATGGAGGSDAGIVAGGSGGADAAILAGDGPLASVDRGTGGDRGGIEAGVSVDARAGGSDVPVMPVPDAAGDAGSVDAPTSWDSSGNSVKADLVTVGDGGCGPDVNPYVLPALAEVNEIYGVCDFPTGLRTETTWMRDLTTTGNLLLVDAYTCVADDDPRVWSATGAQFKIILSESQHSFAYRGPYRIYAIFQDHGASEVRAAYDLSVTLDDGGVLPPPFPEHYARLDLVCGDPDAIPAFKGWTGRIGMSQTSVSVSNGYTETRMKYSLWGTSAGLTGDRALWLITDHPYHSATH